MPSQSWISATAEQREELRALARSSDREEADRARAILLSLGGWTGERITAAFGVRTDSVRHWRWIFGCEGVAGLRARKAPGRAATKAQAAISVIEQVLTPEIADRPNWTRLSPGQALAPSARRDRPFDKLRSAPASASRNRGSAWC